MTTGSLVEPWFNGYWIVSGPHKLGGKPIWPDRWHAQFLPAVGGIYDAWGPTENEARQAALMAWHTDVVPKDAVA